MITRPPARDKETTELIRRFKAKGERRRKIRVFTASILGVALLVIVVTLVVLVTRGPAGDTSDLVSSSTAGGESTTSPIPTTSSTSSKAGASGSLSGSSSSTAGASSSTTSTAGASSSTTSTRPPTSTTAPPAASTNTTQGNGPVVVIDPGHQAKGDSAGEPIGPGSSDTKPKVSSGTAGAATGTPESQLVLTVSLKLRDALAAKGIKVVMTRTSENVDLSNIQRAQIANEAHAALFVRIHADGADDHSISGIHVLYPAVIKGWTDDIAEASKRAAMLAQRELIAATGAVDRGIDARSDMTGFNWADVPAILPEIGFMTNPAEDRLLATAAYQDKIVQGLTKAILAFLGVG